MNSPITRALDADDLRDWTGYELLRADVRSTKVATDVWFIVEDEVLEPPVVRTYAVKPDAWVTVEIDLAKAAEVRGLDLSRMVNFYIHASRQSQIIMGMFLYSIRQQL